MSKKKQITTAEENRLGNLVLALAFIFALMAAFAMVSCGARKVNKSEVSKTETTQQNSVTEEKSTTETNIQMEVVTVENSKDSTITETVEIRPIDNTKPAYFDNNGKIESISNAYFYKTKTYNTSSKLRKENSVLDKLSSKKEDNSLKDNFLKSENIKQLDKEIDKESSFQWYWWLIPIVLIVVAYINRHKIWWV